MNWIRIKDTLVNLDKTLVITVGHQNSDGLHPLFVYGDQHAVILDYATRDEVDRILADAGRDIVEIRKRNNPQNEPWVFTPPFHQISHERRLTREEWKADEAREAFKRLAEVERARCEAEAAGGKVDHPLESPTYPFPRD